MAYTIEDLDEWARRYFPAFHFSNGPGGEAEVFYPSDAEGWLTHQRDASQDGHRRGTTVHQWNAPTVSLTAEQWREQQAVILPGDITLDTNASTGIGAARFTSRPPADPTDPAKGPSSGDWFLNFGGWNDRGVKSTGQAGYDWTAYNSVYSTLGLPASQPPLERDAQPQDLPAGPPTVFSPDTRGLHSYVELRRVGDLLEELLDAPLPLELSSLQNDRSTMQGEADRLKDLLSLSYHLFYPTYVPPDANNRPKLLEGQWEAVSVFLEDKGGASTRMAYASYSQGYENRGVAGGTHPRPLARCRTLGDDLAVEGDGETGTHPTVFVAWGSHANYFTERSSEQSLEPQFDAGAYGGVIVLGGVAAMLLLIGGILVVAGFACMATTTPVDPACSVIIAIGVIVLVVALILVILDAILAAMTAHEEATRQTSLPFDENSPRNDAHAGDGAANDAAAVGTVDAPPANAGSGDMAFLLHLISDHPDVKDTRSEPPPWWTYAGRWGVCVNDSDAQDEGPGWSNGSWRRHPDGYTRTHRNVEALLDYASSEADPIG